MRDTAAGSRINLGGADIHAAVLLHGVGVDDLTADLLGDRQRKVGFPGSGRPDDGDGPHPRSHNPTK